MYKAIFIDVDGTLIRDDDSISSNTIETIQSIRNKNFLIVLVSARPLSGMISIAQSVGLLANPLASLNGAYISLDGEIIFDASINLNLIPYLQDHLKGTKASVIYYEKDKWYSEVKNYDTDYEQKITDVPIIIQPFQKTLQTWIRKGKGPNKILVISEKDRISTIRKSLQSGFYGQLNIATSKSTYLEIMSVKASKLNAVKFLIKRFNIRPEEIISIGDNFNDREMITFAGMGIAMGNAPDEIKKIADHVTTTNNEDGVSVALNKVLGF